MNELLKSIEPAVNPNVPHLEPGDIVSVHVKNYRRHARTCAGIQGNSSFHPQQWRRFQFYRASCCQQWYWR